jgi:hypothetical protein
MSEPDRLPRLIRRLLLCLAVGVAVDAPPLASEILIPLFVWSWWFEIALPRSGVLGKRVVSDYRILRTRSTIGGLILGEVVLARPCPALP